MTFFLHLLKKHWLIVTIIILLPVTVLSLYLFGNLIQIPGTDKTRHFIAYAVLSFPIALAKPKHIYLILIGLFAYSGILELIQPLVNRQSELLDLVANGVGILTGSLAAYLINLLLIYLNKTPNIIKSTKQ